VLWIRTQGFDDQKFKKIQLKFLLFTYLFLIKNCNLQLQEKPSALKREHPALKRMKFITFFVFVGHFCTPGSRLKSCIESGSATLAFDSECFCYAT
jgi:hypothetical protein